jgi:hypothetical protein
MYMLVHKLERLVKMPLKMNVLTVREASEPDLLNIYFALNGYIL